MFFESPKMASTHLWALMIKSCTTHISDHGLLLNISIICPILYTSLDLKCWSSPENKGWILISSNYLSLKRMDVMSVMYLSNGDALLIGMRPSWRNERTKNWAALHTVISPPQLPLPSVLYLDIKNQPLFIMIFYALYQLAWSPLWVSEEEKKHPYLLSRYLLVLTL